MKADTASGASLLETANAMRLGTLPEMTAFDLWLIADRKAGDGHADSRQTRIVLFRHAAIHAGLVTTSRGTVYRRCAMCRENLSA